MKKYRIEFEFMYKGLEVSDEKIHTDVIDNNGEGFIKSDAAYIAKHVKDSKILDVKNVEVIEMEV